MINSLYIAETGLNAQNTFVDVISNNIANTNTSGFKKSSVNFIDLVVPDGVNNSQTTQSEVYGVHVAEVSHDFSQGALKPTGHPFDLAIHGSGFYEVALNDQEVGYTRIGRLRVDQDGYLSTMNGNKLTSNIIIPPDTVNLTVEENGTIMALLAEEENYTELGQLELVRFTNNGGLVPESNGVYRYSEAAGEKIIAHAGEDSMGNIQQGYTEESNVSMVEEMVNLVIAQRGYQLNARVIQISDQLLETINNLRR